MRRMNRPATRGASQLIHAESVPIPAGEVVRFEPGGLHVMLVGVPDGLQAGETLQMKLVFENAGEISIEVPVEER